MLNLKNLSTHLKARDAFKHRTSFALVDTYPEKGGVLACWCFLTT